MNSFKIRVCVFAAALMFAASMWFYADCILVPYQIADAAAHDRPRGYLSDLYPRWLGARELLLHGRDPYSPEITREIQVGYYGRPLDPARKGDPKDQQAFAYPVYVVFFLAPTVRLSFPVVEKRFYDLLWVLTIISVPLWLRALRWRVSLSTTAVLVILTLGSVPAMYGLKVQQLSLVVAALLAASMAAMAAGYLASGGILLGLATIKPQLAWLPAVWLLVWTLRNWRERQRFAYGLGATMAVLLIGAQRVLPGWLGQFWVAVQNYRQYTHNVSVLSWLTNPLFGAIGNIALIVGVAFWCWPYLKDDQRSASFAAMLSVILTATVVFVPMFAPYNQLLLLPAVLVIVRHRSALWRGKAIVRAAFAVTAALVFWPWLATVGMTVASAFLPGTLIQSRWRLPLYNSFSLPLLLFLLLLLGIPIFRSDPTQTQSG